MNQKDQDRLLVLAILVVTLAGLYYSGIALLALLANNGTTFKDFDGAAWTQAVGSVAAIGALVWQRSKETEAERSRALKMAAELQNGARRLVQGAANICAELAAEGWPGAGRLSEAGCGVYQARLLALAGALRRIDTHSLPSWRHTESVVAAISAMDALNFELGRLGAVATPVQTVGRLAVIDVSWYGPFKAMAEEFRKQLHGRAAAMSAGLDPAMDPAEDNTPPLQ